jgi:uncharacterized protein
VKFIDRKMELSALDDFYQSREAALLVLYGRRRVGKTALLNHWRTQHRVPRSLFWTATTTGADYQLGEFSRELRRLDPHPVPPSDDFSFRDWDEALTYLGEVAAQSSTPIVCVIDEFTNLLLSNPALASILQRVWDHKLSNISQLRLILTGSLMGLVASSALDANAPLYGRATSVLKLRPLAFGCLRELFPRWSPVERVAAYSICGGIPAYLRLFADSPRFLSGLETSLKAGSLLLTDTALVLHSTDRLRDPYNYESILSAIASGFHTWSDIAKIARVPEDSLGFYIKNLQSLDLVERRDPVLSRPTASTGHSGRYYIQDHFFRFYYRFIQKHLGAIERGDLKQVITALQDDLRAFIGAYVFEELCREWVWAEGERVLGFLPENVGSHWSQRKGQAVQLDVVAVSPRRRQIFIGEAKWGTGKVRHDVWTDLLARSSKVISQHLDEGWTVRYGLFARDGFTDAVEQAVRASGGIVVDLPQLEDGLVRAVARTRKASIQLEL